MLILIRPRLISTNELSTKCLANTITAPKSCQHTVMNGELATNLLGFVYMSFTNEASRSPVEESITWWSTRQDSCTSVILNFSIPAPGTYALDFLSEAGHP